MHLLGPRSRLSQHTLILPHLSCASRRLRLAGFRFERVKSTTKKAKAASTGMAKDKPSEKSADKKPKDKGSAAAASSSSRKPAADGGESQPRVLVERKELQALQAERRTLFGRVDEAVAQQQALRQQLDEKEEALHAARVAAAQQQEVWVRHDALRCEERESAATRGRRDRPLDRRGRRGHP